MCRYATYAYLFSMSLMGHISLGASCLSPGYKRYEFYTCRQFTTINWPVES